MKKRIKLKKRIAYLLTTTMVLGFMVCTPGNMMNVQAADGSSTSTTKTIAGLGTDIMADPTEPTSSNDVWTGSYVYFGTYDANGDGTAEPVKYRVLDSKTTVFGGTTMFLDCNSILWSGSDPSSAFDEYSNIWVDSDIREYLNGTFLTNNFSIAEQNAISESIVESHELTTDSADGVNVEYWAKRIFGNYVALDRDKVFLLDAEDVNNGAYGYSLSNGSVINRMKKDAGGTKNDWWLRSAQTNYSRFTGSIDSFGILDYEFADEDIVGVSPALNVNLSSVLFSSVITGTAGDTGAEYKLTLIDSDMTIAGNGYVTRNGDIVTIPYTISGINSTNATQVSVFLLDKEYNKGNTNDAEVLYYGTLDTSANNGTGTFTLPSELSDKVCGEDYYMYIIAEDVNGTYETDYASEPIEIGIYDEISRISVGVDTPVVGTVFDTSVTTSEIGFSATTVIWQAGNNTATGNADYDTAYTVNITLTVDSGYAFADNVTATVNNHTAIVTGNDDGTITVSYTFEKTQIGTITHTATGYEGTYDGQPHGITVEVTDPSDTTVTYSTDGTNYSATNPTFTDAGTYTVYYKLTKDRYESVTGEAIVIITKKELSVKADNQTVTVGESIDKSEYNVSGLVSGDTVSSVTITSSTIEVTDNGTIEVSGAKIVNADGKDVTANYNIAYTAGRLVVNEVEIPTPEEPQPEEPTTEDDKTPTSPITGDNNSIGLWLLLLIGSGLTLVGFRKKKNYIA